MGNGHVRVAVSVNACDHLDQEDRNGVMLQRELADMRSLGFVAEELDLRNYFGKDGLGAQMKQYELVWFSGGNAFLLVKAFKQSGFDKVLESLVLTDHLVYAGYSAAFCAISPSLHGMELVDDKDVKVAGYQDEVIWDGYGLVDFYPLVHFRSNHHESDLVEKAYEYVKANNIAHKTFQDGDVFVVNSAI